MMDCHIQVTFRNLFRFRGQDIHRFAEDPRKKFPDRNEDGDGQKYGSSKE